EGCTSLKAIYYVGTAEQLSASPVSNVITATTKSYAEYKALSDKSGVYAVYDYSRCEAYNNGVHGALTGGNACAGTCSVCNDTVVSHSETAVTAVTIEYASYLSAGTKITSCTNEGCTHTTEETVDALFICQGVSASQTGNGLSLGFKVNNEAIATYTSTTGKTLKYGVFAGSQSNLGAKDIFDAEISEKVITAEIKATEFTAFDIKVVGFQTDVQKSTLLAIGAYVEVSKDGVTEYSYMQEKDPSENAKYYFASYNDMLN
ncbi:MAG: hypothetical protein IJ039_00180, partial [Clostridia bacterium]|nr:hypothetical protein [Clostridia bacterium]